MYSEFVNNGLRYPECGNKPTKFQSSVQAYKYGILVCGLPQKGNKMEWRVKCQKTNIFLLSADIKQIGTNIYSKVFSQSGLH